MDGMDDMTPPGDDGMMTQIPTSCQAPQPNAAPGNTCPGTPPPALTLTEIASGLVGPTYVAQAPGDPTRLYILEQQGRIKVVKDGVLSPTPVADLSGGTVSAAEILPGNYSENGLLGMVFDPQFETTGRLWLSFTKPGLQYSVTEYTMSDPDTLDMSSAKELLNFPQYAFAIGDATNHVGSMLAFGPDGCMYISRGDGGGEYDRQNSGQDTSDDLCSILRIDVDTYPTPAPGNHDGHVWNYGFRNPWRFSFDSETGDLYIGDVGQDVGSGFEEIMVEPRGVVGRNYGWSVMEGSSVCSGVCDGMTPPALEYGTSQTANSVIGGYVYRGSNIPGLVGRYIWADWSERQIKTFVYAGDQGGQAMICDEYDTGITASQKIRSFGEGIDGEIYVVTAGAPGGNFDSAGNAEPGTLYRIDPM